MYNTPSTYQPQAPSLAPVLLDEIRTPLTDHDRGPHCMSTQHTGEHAGVRDAQVADPVDPEALIDDPGLWIVGHATGTAGVEADSGHTADVAVNLVVRDSIPSLCRAG